MRSPVQFWKINSDAADWESRDPVAFFFAATGGGVQRNRIALATALAERGVTVDCVLPQARGPFLDNLPSQVRIVDLNTRNPVKVVLRLARYIRIAHPVTLLASQQHTNLAAIWARQLSRVPVKLIITQHIHLSSRLRHNKRLFVRLLLPTLVRFFFGYADRIVAVSEGVADDLAAITGLARTRIDVIYNPVVRSDLLVARCSIQSGHPWLDHKDRPVVLGAGTLTGAKNFALLLRAFARLRGETPARLIIIGEGQERSNLQRLARRLGVDADVDLPGFVPNPYAYMGQADVFVLSSRFEGLPTVLIEAMACGCPVVSTDCPSGPAEILDRGRFGRLVAVDDDCSLAEAIRHTIQAPPQRDALRQRAELFSADRSVKQYIDLIGPEIESRRATRSS